MNIEIFCVDTGKQQSLHVSSVIDNNDLMFECDDKDELVRFITNEEDNMSSFIIVHQKSNTQFYDHNEYIPILYGVEKFKADIKSIHVIKRILLEHGIEEDNDGNVFDYYKLQFKYL
jgi:hypothetical protein